MMMNPMQFLSAMRNGGNPQQMVMGMLQNMSGNNPMAANVLRMAQNGDTQGIMNFARNVCNGKGVSFDRAFADFRRQNGL